ncbi:glycosyltransferase, partial [Methylobacterium sp. CCH5-D2]|uniref:glycosyltransferase n=1 Tax=Methylobacterium sp. CCH5-D2 TaxID=1768765 RepID=UPI000B209C9B
MSGSDPASVAVGLTLFRPSPAQVEAVCRLAAASPGPVLAFDNGGLPAGAAEALERAGIRLLSAGRNLGIAAALNALAETATGLGARRILLLDQDAGPQGEMLRALLAAADRLDGAARSR